MFCKNCGSENLESAKFCKSCGASLLQVQDQFSRREPRQSTLREKKKWNKKILVFSAGIILVVVVLIGFENGWFKSNKSATIQQPTDQSQPETPTPAPTPVTQEPAESPPPEAPKTETYFYDVRDFSNGVAWVQRESSSPWECIDNKGNTLFSLDEGSEPKTDFSNEGAIIETTDSNNKTKEEIIDKSGNVVFPKDDGYEYRIVDSYGNYHFVTRHINTFEKTEDQIGIVDNAGNWVLEPTPDLEIYKSSLSIGYGGIGNVSYKGNDYYDAHLNEFFKKPNKVTSTDDWEDKKINNLELIRRTLPSLYADDLYFFRAYNKDYSLKGTNMLYISYFDDPNFDLTKLGFNNSVTGFYDQNKELVIDLSSYNDPEAIGGFSNGYCSLSLKNPQNSPFWTIIDKKGNKMFEPITEPIGKVSCGRSLVKPKEGSEYYIDVNGKTAIPDIEDGSDFNEDCLAKIGNTSNGGDNQIYFIDTDGNIAF